MGSYRLRVIHFVIVRFDLQSGGTEERKKEREGGGGLRLIESSITENRIFTDRLLSEISPLVHQTTDAVCFSI